MYKVYIQANPSGIVTAINSDAFLPDTTDWVQIDEGDGDRCHHAQGNYLPKPLTTTQGIYRYKLVDGVITERTVEEMAPEIAAAQLPMITRRSIEDYLRAAMQTDKGYLAIPDPTATDRAAQTVKLTRQNIRIMRLLLKDMAAEE